jgi:hypothetical protein
VAASFGASLAVALAIGLGIQAHPGALLLATASLGLLAAGVLRVRWSAVVTGSAIAALPLVPWLLAIDEHPDKLPISEGFLGRGLVLLFPVRGAGYWLRYVSFHLPNKETRFDFTPVLDSALAPALRILGDVLVKGIGPVSVLVAVAANVWLWRRLRRRGWRDLLGGGDGGARRWTLAYLRITFLAALVLFALAPTTVMWWQPLPLLHAAVLTAALAVGVLARRRPGLVRAGIMAWTALAVTFALLLAFGGPRHRCGGRSNIVIPLRHDHPMLYDLGIHDSCRVPIEPSGWWPDVLPEPAPEAAPSL